MKTNSNHSTLGPAAQSIQELRAELAKKIAWFIGSSERRVTEVPGLLLVPQDCTHCALLRDLHAGHNRGCPGQ